MVSAIPLRNRIPGYRAFAAGPLIGSRSSEGDHQRIGDANAHATIEQSFEGYDVGQNISRAVLRGPGSCRLRDRPLCRDRYD